MRRLGAAVGGVLLLAACTVPAGTDGDLDDDWAAPPQPVSWRPDSGTCQRTGFTETVRLAGYAPVDCAREHLVETVHVGRVEGERLTVPPDGSAEQRAGYAECLDRSTAFLGDDWRTGRLWLGVAMPSRDAWSGGARWFRCDLWEIRRKGEPAGVLRTGTLRDALRGGGLRHGCTTAAVKNGQVQSMSPVECSRPHNAEFAGVYVAPDVPYPASRKDLDDLSVKGCRGVAARFAAIPDDGDLYFRTGLITEPFSAREWERGNRGVLCHLWLSRSVSRSMKGAGPTVLPAN